MPSVTSNVGTGELAEKNRALEEELQRLKVENMELKKDIAENALKSVRTSL